LLNSKIAESGNFFFDDNLMAFYGIVNICLF